MKHKILNSFMFLALLLSASGTKILASEVTGNLSSGGNNGNAQSTTQTQPSASNTNTQENPGAQSSNGGANETPDNGIIAGNVGDGSSEAPPESRNGGEVLGSAIESSTTATAFGSASLFSPSDWFWIITLLLLLIAVVTYIYNHDKELARRTELHY